MGFRLSLFFVLASLSAIFAQKVAGIAIVVNGTAVVAETDSNFVCATIDWWPHDKCSYGYCPWEHTSAINMNLSNPFLAKAIQAFKHLRIRIGGSLQDQVLYDIGKLRSPCHPFSKVKDGLFEFSKGCLHMTRWDELNHLFSKTGAIVTFGLNALYGRRDAGRGVWAGDWDSSNAHNFINYTVSKGYQIDSWEFGNELSGKGIGASVSAEQYGKDLIKLKGIINKLYNNSEPKPSLIAPGGFFDEWWYAKLLKVSGSDVVNVMTHHIYNLGAGGFAIRQGYMFRYIYEYNKDPIATGNDPGLVSKILNPHYLSEISGTFRNLRQTIQMNGPWASAWVGESGGAYNSGGRHVSNTFLNSFWYLDQLGMASKYNTKVYCRQALVGGFYSLLNTTTFVPNPDYYSALLWHRLMGKGVLAVNSSASPFLRSYAHCSKGRAGVTLLLINLCNQTEFTVNVHNSMTLNLHKEEKTVARDNSITHGLKETVSWVGSKASDGSFYREEYHLTPKDGYLRSQTMLLNKTPLELTDAGEIPSLIPVLRDANSPITVASLSIAFIVLPNFDAPACV